MPSQPAFRYILDLWIAVGVVWLLAAFGSKRATRTEPAPSRLLHITMMAVAFGLVFSSWLAVPPLTWRVLPDWPALPWLGLLLTAAGCTVAVWARLLLGGNWSATVTVKRDHRLIRRGPYNFVRHPIYSGGLLGLLGTALALGQLRGFLGLALAFVGWLMKSRIEEAFLTAEFGAEYLRYEHEVKALIPFVL